MLSGSSKQQSGGAPDTKVRRGRSDGTWPLHPFLFAAASVMALMANSLNQAAFADVLPAIGGALFAALAFYLLAAVVRRRLDAKAAVIASIWVVGSMFYAGLFEAINRRLGGGYSMVPSLPVALVLMMLATFIATRLPAGPAKVLNIVLNAIAVVLIATPLWSAVSYAIENREAGALYDADQAAAALPAAETGAATQNVARPPDIFHFIFDRYAAADVLAEHYGTDNSAILDYLEGEGFYVARSSHSNYLKTGHSVASTFYMDYLDNLANAEGLDENNWHPIFKMLDDHRVARFLKARGYRFEQYGSWWRGTFHNAVADENHPFGLSEFNMLYLRRTILRPLFHTLPDTPATMQLDWDNGQCQRVARQVEAIKAIEPTDQPTYVFAHFLLPHGPYNFTAEGECLTAKESAERGSDQGYVDQIAYANLIIRDIVDALLARGGEPPVILIQADEGPFPERDGSVPWQDATAEELRIKTGILNAYYFPDGDYGALTDDITPVNSYRAVFNDVFDAGFELLPNRIIAFSHDWVIYDFHDVTAKVMGETPDSAAGQAEMRPD